MTEYGHKWVQILSEVASHTLPLSSNSVKFLTRWKIHPNKCGNYMKICHLKRMIRIKNMIMPLRYKASISHLRLVWAWFNSPPQLMTKVVRCQKWVWWKTSKTLFTSWACKLDIQGAAKVLERWVCHLNHGGATPPIFCMTFSIDKMKIFWKFEGHRYNIKKNIKPSFSWFVYRFLGAFF